MITVAWASWETKFGSGCWRVYEDGPNPHRECEELVLRSEAEAKIAELLAQVGKLRLAAPPESDEDK